MDSVEILLVKKLAELSIKEPAAHSATLEATAKQLGFESWAACRKVCEIGGAPAAPLVASCFKRLKEVLDEKQIEELYGKAYVFCRDLWEPQPTTDARRFLPQHAGLRRLLRDLNSCLLIGWTEDGGYDVAAAENAPFAETVCSFLTAVREMVFSPAEERKIEVLCKWLLDFEVARFCWNEASGILNHQTRTWSWNWAFRWEATDAETLPELIAQYDSWIALLKQLKEAGAEMDCCAGPEGSFSFHTQSFATASQFSLSGELDSCNPEYAHQFGYDLDKHRAEIERRMAAVAAAPKLPGRGRKFSGSWSPRFIIAECDTCDSLISTLEELREELIWFHSQAPSVLPDFHQDEEAIVFQTRDPVIAKQFPKHGTWVSRTLTAKETRYFETHGRLPVHGAA